MILTSFRFSLKAIIKNYKRRCGKNQKYSLIINYLQLEPPLFKFLLINNLAVFMQQRHYKITQGFKNKRQELLFLKQRRFRNHAIFLNRLHFLVGQDDTQKRLPFG